MSLRRRLQVLQDRPGLRLRASTIADLAGLPYAFVDVELFALKTDGWVDTEYEPGNPRLWWLVLEPDGEQP